MPDPDLDLREWLCTSGHGAYASGTVAGPATRRYHGLLVAAVDPPAHRRMVLAAIDATVEIAGESLSLATHRYRWGTLHPDGTSRLATFASEPWPTWKWRLAEGTEIVRTLRFQPQCNAILVE
ncbi:MAG: glycogen debranching enzyme N-terminal domain-containing protein, partial [Armatimonadota bacterium]